MRSTSQNDGVRGARRSGASCVFRRWRRRRRPAGAGDHARGVARAGLDSRYGSGRKRRSGRGRDGVGVRQIVGVAVTDRAGRFELRTLSPGPYLVRAHSSGFIASRAQIVDVRPSARSASSIALRHSPTPGNLLVVSDRRGGHSAAGRTRAGAGRCDRHRREPPTRRRTITATSRGGCVICAAASSRTRRSPTNCSRVCRTTKGSFGAGGFSNRSFGSPAHLASQFLRRHTVFRTGESADDRFVRLAAAALFERQLLARHRVPGAWRAGRRTRGLDRARGADAGRPRVVDCGRRIHDARSGAAPLRHRPVVQHAALRRRQFRGAAEPDRRQPQRRRALRLRHLLDYAARHAHLRRALRALRLSRRPEPVEPARRAHVRAGRSLPRQHDAVAPRSRTGRRRIHAADGRRASGCRRSGRSRR